MMGPTGEKKTMHRVLAVENGAGPASGRALGA